MARLALKPLETERVGYRLNDTLASLLCMVLSPEDYEAVLHCPEFFITAVAADGCKVPVHYDCNVRGCPTREWVKHKTSWMKAVEDLFRLYQASGIRVSFKRVVGTVPDYLRETVYAMPERKFRAMLVRTLERLYSAGGRYQLLYMISNHIHSTSDPFSGPKPHLDCNLFNIAYDRMTGKYVAIDLFVDVNSARKYWFEELSAIEGFHSADVDIRFEPVRAGWHHVAQAVRYSVRSPVRDVFDFLKGRSVPEGVSISWLRDLLVGRRKRQSYVWGGIFSNAVRKRTQTELGFQVRSRREFERESKSIYCEHGELLERDYYSPPMSVSDVRIRGLRFVHWLEDPPIWEQT